VANDEHLAILRQGVSAWNEWREPYPRIQPDLSGANLSYANLRGFDLNGAHLGGANLSGAQIHDARLDRAILNDANLLGANLRYANLISANLTGANLTAAKLDSANLTAANLTGAELWGASLRYANLTGAIVEGSIFKNTSFHGTIFGQTSLEHAIGLDDCVHSGPSIIDLHTLQRSGNLPLSFLRGCGLPNTLIHYLPSLRGEAIQFYSCFISYSAKDQVFADELHADLQNKGVRCWFAPHDLPIGAKTWDAIDQAIRLREKLLLILSKSSIASEWVEDEVNKAYAEERSRKQIVLFPIRIDNVAMSTAEPWAVKLRDQRNIGDFRQWKKPDAYQRSLDRLLRDLRTAGPKAE